MKCLQEWLPVLLLTCSIRSTAGYLPVMLVDGVSLNDSSSLFDHLISRIEKAHPGTPIFVSQAYPGAESFTPAWDQIRGKLGQEFVNFSNSYPDGFHYLGYSQGGILGRAMIETYCHHNVVNFISLSAPLAGYYGPSAYYNITIPDQLLRLVMNNPITQKTYVLANYFHDPYHHCEYLKYNAFLPYMDNEIRTNMSKCYKRGFTRCDKIIMIGGPDDGVVVPWQSSHFSYYNKFGKVVDFRNRKPYQGDWFGLKTMDQEGRLDIHAKSGVRHGMWPQDDDVIDRFIMPYLT